MSRQNPLNHLTLPCSPETSTAPTTGLQSLLLCTAFQMMSTALAKQWALLNWEEATPWQTYKAILLRLIYNRCPLLLMSQLMAVSITPLILRAPPLRCAWTWILWLLMHPLTVLTCISALTPDILLSQFQN